MKKVKAEVRKKLEQLIGTQLNNEKLMKAINCRVMQEAGYIINVCTLGQEILKT